MKSRPKTLRRRPLRRTRKALKKVRPPYAARVCSCASCLWLSTLAACTTLPPAISQIDSDSVEVVLPAWPPPQDRLDEADTEATRGCEFYNRVPVRVSSRPVDCVETILGRTCDLAVLYACRLPSDELRPVD